MRRPCRVRVRDWAAALAQTDLQLWGNVTLDWVKSDRLVYELDFDWKRQSGSTTGRTASGAPRRGCT